ncbi:MAG: hypothetical protein MUD11_16440, partial [Rhodobacteraceae bacterium]|nr:hypothetical protein [Paracoccaceae bacterium]
MPQPALLLDFTTDTYHPGGFGTAITFTRAGSARYHDASGVMQTAVVDTPRIDYDPATLARRGLLIEGARTNLLLQSATFGGPAPGLNTDLLASAVNAPISGQTMMFLRETVAAGNHHISFVYTLAAGLHTLSAYFKAGARTKMRYVLTGATLGTLTLAADLVAGTATIIAGTGAAQIVDCGGGIYRVIVIFPAAASEVITLRIRLCDAVGLDAYTGDGTSGFYLWGGQLEPGNCATSYIETTTAATTRLADVAVLPLGAWWNPAEGTMLIEWQDINQQSGNSRIIGMDGLRSIQNLDGGIGPGGNNANQLQMWNGAVAFGATPGPTTDLTKGIQKGASAWSGAGRAVAIRNTLATSPALLFNTDSPTFLSLGATDTGSGSINGCLRKITYWPKRL